eukprot:TRINITY_DN30978_c0_g1_i1.p1 TRINITY_DN30978_c0_g1~~TRINITY_DN30978_c0_g1_i1.p1  ORF type:complete len:282 (+),score=55.08 TRINITY_DN30978_c0_g1_i1:126-971(+)
MTGDRTGRSPSPTFEEDNSPKQARVRLPTAPPAEWLASFRTVVTEAVAPIGMRPDGIEEKQNTQAQMITDLTTRVGALESASPPSISGISSFTTPAAGSARIEARGWCTHTSRNTHGYSRLQAVELLTKLRQDLPQDVKEQVAENPILFATKNISMLVVVRDASYISEVTAFFKETLQKMSNESDQINLFCRRELPPERRESNALLAKCLSFCALKLKDKAQCESSWHPDYAVLVTSPQGNGPIARVNPEDRRQPIWTDLAPILFGISKENITAAFRAYKP